MRAAWGSLEVAQARVSARLGGVLADDAAWARLETARELRALLEAARSSRVARWVRDIVPGAGLHEIEAVLRAHWRAEIAEVAGWMPSAWGDAIAWTGTLADVPLLQHVARRDPVPAWASADARTTLLQQGAPPQRDPEQRLAAALRRLAGAGDGLADAWCTEWWARVPPRGRGLPSLHAFARLTGRLLRVPSAAVERRALRPRLRALFRASTLEPALAFAYLALAALELERVRGELVSRIAFDPAGLPLAA